jgi:hypothetical protein
MVGVLAATPDEFVDYGLDDVNEARVLQGSGGSRLELAIRESGIGIAEALLRG